MTDSIPRPGGGLDGGWRHRPRPVRQVRADLPDVLGASSSGEGSDASNSAPPEACPWLYLATEPNARAAFVVDTHRCELRPDVVPGPGHQLGYCLTTNHPSCPQLRAYEAQRQAEAQSQPPQPQPVPPGPAQPPIAAAIAPQPPAPASDWIGRAPWLVVGALSAVVVVLVLTLAYAAPGGRTATADPPGVTAPHTARDVRRRGPRPRHADPGRCRDRAGRSSRRGRRNLGRRSRGRRSASGEAADAADAPADETPSEPEVQLIAYIVEPGDTLLTISWKFGVTVDDLLAANDLDFDSPIYFGLPLVVPIPAE